MVSIDHVKIMSFKAITTNPFERSLPRKLGDDIIEFTDKDPRFIIPSNPYKEISKLQSDPEVIKPSAETMKLYKSIEKMKETFKNASSREINSNIIDICKKDITKRQRGAHVYDWENVQGSEEIASTLCDVLDLFDNRDPRNYNDSCIKLFKSCINKIYAKEHGTQMLTYFISKFDGSDPENLNSALGDAVSLFSLGRSSDEMSYNSTLYDRFQVSDAILRRVNISDPSAGYPLEELGKKIGNVYVYNQYEMFEGILSKVLILNEKHNLTNLRALGILIDSIKEFDDTSKRLPAFTDMVESIKNFDDDGKMYLREKLEEVIEFLPNSTQKAKASKMIEAELKEPADKMG